MNTSYLAHLASEPSLGFVLQQAGLSIDQNVLLCLVDLWLDKVRLMAFSRTPLFHATSFDFLLYNSLFHDPTYARPV